MELLSDPNVWIAFAMLTALDIVFSLDSVITAVGMVDQISAMVAAVVTSVGVMLVAEGLGQHVNKGYIYFAMGFSVFVEVLNLNLRRRGKVVALHGPHASDLPPDAPLV